MSNPQPVPTFSPSSVPPSNYVARKATRHYYEAVAKFLGGTPIKDIDSYSDHVANAIKPFCEPNTPGKPKWENGDYFFAAIVPRNKTPCWQHIAIGAFLDYGPRPRHDQAEQRIANLAHIAVNDDLLEANLRLLPGFFQ